jgi:hypothetical protein
MAEKSSWAPGKQTAENLVWFGEIERKLAKLSKTTFTYRSSSYLFYGWEHSLLFILWVGGITPLSLTTNLLTS